MTYGTLTNSEAGASELSSQDLLQQNKPEGAVARLWCCRRSTSLLIMYVPLYCLYIAGGALIFRETEGTLEEAYRVRLREKRAEFLQEHPCVSGEHSNVSR